MRIVRSHTMKMLYRYLAIDTDLRDRLSHSNKLPHFLEACRICRERIEQGAYDGKPIISWYNRHKHGLNSFDPVDDSEKCPSWEGGCASETPSEKKAAKEDDDLCDAFSIFQLGGEEEV
jgi:hypothetical protein